MKKEATKTGWNFDNSYANLPKIFYTKQYPSPVKKPELIIFNEPLAKLLGLDEKEINNNLGAKIFSGNLIPEGAKPLAQAYAGHQFGHFTMLGDGRAILLGEQVTPTGERYDIQLKGSGRTPYSRGGDGRAALGPMLREYIVSEAMYALGIPTTRSLAVVATGEPVIRSSILKGAILTRVASSHIRVGTFQFAATWGNYIDLKALADYTIDRHFINLKNEDNKYLLMLKEVVERQAKLISKWMLVGFIHGVMNTDNVAISGETIDYGPCAFMDTYNPETVFSSIDLNGRYAYKNQPIIGEWNLSRFAEALLPLIHENIDKAVDMAQDVVSDFNNIYKKNWLDGIRKKLGIFNEEEEDEKLINDLLNIMYRYKADYTNTFISLTFDKQEQSELFNSLEFKDWRRLWHERLTRQQETKESVNELMKNSNPAVIPRNHRVEEALSAAENGDFSVINRLNDILSKPFAHTSEQEEYAKLPPPSTCPYKTFCGT